MRCIDRKKGEETMKRTATYYKDSQMKEPFTIKYDDESPCLRCGEPVVSASMGGTAICPWCDMGKCRYCSMPIFVVKEEIDGGQSKRELLAHMKYHRDKEPEFNNRQLQFHREFEASLKAKSSTPQQSDPEGKQ